MVLYSMIKTKSVKWVCLLSSLALSASMMAACAQNNVQAASPHESTGYTAQELTFPMDDTEKTEYNADIFEIEPFSVSFELPDGWSVGEYDPQAETYLYSGVWSRAGIYNADEQCIGAIGYNTFVWDETAEEEPMATYNQVALGNDYQFNVKNTYTVVADSSTGETALVDVYHSPVLDEASAEEKINLGILSYNREKEVYIALELDSASVSKDEATSIATSIVFN